MALRRGNHFKANPGNVTVLLAESLGDVGPSEGLSSARRLFANGLAVFVDVEEEPDSTFLRITDTGIALADNYLEGSRKLTVWERVKVVPRSDWIALFALIVSAIALIRGD